MSLNCIGNINSEFTNYALRNKNSYLLFTADFNEDSQYGRFGCNNFRSFDWDFTHNSTLCYETIDIKSCTKCFYSQKLENCSEIYFGYNLKNCHNCIFSTNLINQKNCIFNKQVEQEEFEKLKTHFNTHESVAEAWIKFKEFLKDQPRKYLEMIQCEESVGDYIKNCKNAVTCFDSANLHDVKYGSQLGGGAKDCMDWDFYGAKSELCYEMVSCAYQLQNCKFTMNSWEGNYGLTYCDLCLGSKNLFGCISLRKKENCILNKQYSAEEYQSLKNKLIEHMEQTGEWGEFMPAKYSPFAYNESVAQEYFPLTREEATAKGYNWKEKDSKEYQKANGDILACEECGKNYRLTDGEKIFYKEFSIPEPHACYNCRHKGRMALRNPKEIIDRKCSKCEASIKTTYKADRPEPIYCEKCYLEAIF